MDREGIMDGEIPTIHDQYSPIASCEAYTHKYVATDVVGHSNELSPVCLLKK